MCKGKTTELRNPIQILPYENVPVKKKESESYLTFCTIFDPV